MADVKISQLPAATTPVDGTEVLPIVQSATTKQVSIANLTAGRAMAAASLTLTTPLAVTSGGTGLATVAQGALLSATAADTISATRTPTLGLAGTAAGTLGLSGSTSGVVTLQTAAAAGTWSMTLPTSGGTNGYILTTNGAGVTSWTNPTALGVDLDVGGTAITGGTSGRVLYDNAGVLGEYAVTGTGSVVLGTTPTFTTSALFPAGTVGAPGISVSGDTNTGIYFPAADTIGFAEGGVESMRLDSSGNLGLGVTPSAWSQGRAFEILNTGYGLWNGTGSIYTLANTYFNGGFKYAANGQASHYYQYQGAHVWSNAPNNTSGVGATASFTQAMTLDASGNLGVGTTSIAARLHVSGSDATNVAFNGSTRGIRFDFDGTQSNILGVDNTFFGSYQPLFVSGSYLALGTGLTERARIDANGNVIINTAAIATNATNGFLYVPTCAGTPTGTPTTYTGRSPIVVDTTNNKLYFYSGGTWRDAGP